MRRPLPNEYSPSFQSYIDSVKGDNIVKIMQDQILSLQSLLTDIPEDKEEYSYAPGKWTIKEVLGHITDTERIMTYRALCISRGEKASLPGFDENSYVANGNFNSRSVYDLSHEFSQVRESSLSLFKSFTEEMLDKVGTANGKEISVRALLFVCAGHAAHHFRVIKAKYLFD